MEGSILEFDDSKLSDLWAKGPSVKPEVPLATQNPYNPLTSPPNILQYLPPNGSKFGLFADPFARMVYYQPKTGNHSAKYWLQNRIEEHSFTEKEIKLIDFLTRHRCATSSQIKRGVFSDIDNSDTVKKFIKTAHQRGIIAAFSWTTPCQDGLKKPLIYGLTRTGALAAEHLFHVKVPKDYQFQAVTFPNGTGPIMEPFFFQLVANELFAQLRQVDRVLKWERSPFLPFEGQGHHRPQFSAELIKDFGDYKTLWVEIVRTTDKWVEHLIKRFQWTQTAHEKLPTHLKPSRLILIADSDSRIPFIAALAEEYMPDVVIRFTTDERLLAGMKETTFLSFDPVKEEIIGSPIPFLLEGASGMKASEYLAQQTVEFDEDFEDM